MGLIRSLLTAGSASVGSTLKDQWKEFFYCESIPNDTLMVKGQRKITNGRNANKGSDNIISNGSGIAVADGQCMIIVDQGKVVEICAEPGEFTYDTSTEPSIFSGKLGKSIVDSFKTIGRRFTYGGDTAKDQRIYYVNTKEILDNKFGTSSPVMFKVVDSKIALDIDVPIKCSGVYTFQIVNPILFYTSIAGNVSDEYKKEDIASTMKIEFVQALQPALNKVSKLEVRPSDLSGYVKEIATAVNDELSQEWGEGRGIDVIKVALNPIVLDEEWQKKISDAQYEARLQNPGLAAAGLTQAQIQAMKDAANNSAGAMNGFIGMGMAQNMGGVNAGNLFQMAENQKAQEEKIKASEPKNDANAWKCPNCGKMVTGNFCTECGAKKPLVAASWKCPSCGAENTGKFCSNCGTKKPEAKCSNCGYVPEDPSNPPKFCPECGNKF